MSDERRVTSRQGPAGQSGRPLPRWWWVPGIVYALAYTVSLPVPILLVSSGLGHESTLYVTYLVLFGSSGRFGFTILLIPLVICSLLVFISQNWVKRVIEGRVSTRQIAVAAITSGCVASAAHIGLEVLHKRHERTQLLLHILGPLPGILWLACRPKSLRDPDYDDEMTLENLPALSRAQIELPCLSATESFGRRLGGLLFPNAVVALVGPLGAGKTHLSRAIAEGLGIANPAAVTSPTFTLIHEYPARLPIYHFDAYRLSGPNEFLDLGVTEYFEAGGVCLIEWADKVESALPAERLTIRIAVVDENRRRVEMIAVGQEYQAIVGNWRLGAANNECQENSSPAPSRTRDSNAANR